MTDYEQINKRTKHPIRTLNNVIKFEPIPMGATRVVFENKSWCKVSSSYEFKEILGEDRRWK